MRGGNSSMDSRRTDASVGHWLVGNMEHATRPHALKFVECH